VLVENAGGLSAMEALACGLPVVTFRPIAGHGRDNARQMARAGVSRYARSRAQLQLALAEASSPGLSRQRMITPGRALFDGDPADDVVELAAWDLTRRRAPRRLALLRVAVAASLLVVVYAGATVGTQAAAMAGIGVAKAPAGEPNAVYLGVR